MKLFKLSNSDNEHQLNVLADYEADKTPIVERYTCMSTKLYGLLAFTMPLKDIPHHWAIRLLVI
jgi:hypothetical protein